MTRQQQWHMWYAFARQANNRVAEALVPKSGAKGVSRERMVSETVKTMCRLQRATGKTAGKRFRVNCRIAAECANNRGGRFWYKAAGGYEIFA